MVPSFPRAVRKLAMKTYDGRKQRHFPWRINRRKTVRKEWPKKKARTKLHFHPGETSKKTIGVKQTKHRRGLSPNSNSKRLLDESASRNKIAIRVGSFLLQREEFKILSPAFLLLIVRQARTKWPWFLLVAANKVATAIRFDKSSGKKGISMAKPVERSATRS